MACPLKNAKLCPNPPGRDPYGLLPPGDPLRRGKKMGYITSPRRPQSTEKGTSLYVPYFLSGFSGLAVKNEEESELSYVKFSQVPNPNMHG